MQAVFLFLAEKLLLRLMAKESYLAKRTASNIVSFERDDNHAGAKFFVPLELPLFPLPALDSRSTPPDGSGFASLAVTARPARFAGIRGFIVSFGAVALDLRSTPPDGSGFALLAVTARPPPASSAAKWLHCLFHFAVQINFKGFPWGKLSSLRD